MRPFLRATGRESNVRPWRAGSFALFVLGAAGLAAGQDQPAAAAGPAPAEPAGEARAAAAVEWTESDTRLANHYIRLLEANPEYGNVLNLLWGLYEKRGQTGLLLDYFRQAAEQQGTVVVRTLYGHLLRKNEQLDEARELYSAILETEPDQYHALRGAAEISDQQKRAAKALALYNRLIETVPIGTEDGAAFRLRQAALLKESGQLDEAAAVWNALLAAWPGNVALRSEIISLLIEAGRTEAAVKALGDLAAAADPEARLEALQSLARLHEFVGDFDEASATLREAMGLLHFQHHEFGSLFERLVRLHERFDQLPELERSLEAAASQANPSERSVYLMAQFHRLTANPAAEETWAGRLADLVPGNVDYQLQLVDVRMRNDHYEAAAEALDRLIAAQAEAPLSLTLLRSRVALNLEGREAAEAIVDGFLRKWPDLEPAALQAVLAFAREHYLDGLVERLLGGQQGKMLAGGDSEAAPVELARFFRERGRARQAEQTLLDYVAEAESSSVLKAARLAEVTAAFRELDLIEAALAAIQEAIALAPDNLDFRIKRAEIFIDQKRIDEAVAAFEDVWERSPDLKAKTDIDQRLFSLLRGLTDEPASPAAPSPPPASGPIQTLEQYRAAAAAASAGGRSADDPPPRRLVGYYERIKDQANRTSTLAARYRAGWWAIKLQDIPEASHQLNMARSQAGGEPVVEVEKMLLSVAELYEQYPMMARQLETLTRIDPDNALDYRQRRAEVRFALGYEDEAIRELEALAANPDAALNTLKTLASLYQKQGRSDAQVAIWQEAYRRADLFEKRNIVKQLTTTLVELGKQEEALKAQMDLIRRETDPIQKRKEFDAQLSIASRHFLLTWMSQQYQDLAQQHPFDQFYPEALSRIHRSQGDHAAAYLAMKRAYYMSGQDRELLDELGELAGLTKDLKAAIYYRRQMIALNESETSPETWQSLVDMLERDLRVGEADQIRERLESKFTQDADFLTQLSRTYQAAGRWSDAERVLARLTSLRPWDAASWLEYGLVLTELGRSGEALPAFEKAIEETREAARRVLAGAERLALWPVISSREHAGAGTAATGGDPDPGGLAAMRQALTDYPYIEPDAQQAIVAWLEKPHPEFGRTPSKARDLRLRAIEEAARLHGGQPGTRQAWVRRWLEDAEAGPVEKLWAVRHAGAGEETVRLMREVLQPMSGSLERFLFTVVALRLGREDEVIAWVKGSGAPAPARPDAAREVYPVLGLLALLSISDRSPEADAGPIPWEAIGRSLPMAPAVSSFLFDAIRDERRDAEALAFGRAVWERSPRENPELMLELAQVAGKLGLDPERSEWLGRCLESLEFRQFSGLPYYYFQVVSERYQDLESAAEREALLRGLRERVDRHPGMSASVKWENRALLALLEGDGDEAVRSVAGLVGRQMDLVRPSKQADQRESFPQMEGWAQMERILHAFAARRSPGIDPGAFFGALDPDLIADPRNLEAVSQYEQFEMERICWKLEHLGPMERERELLYLYARLRDPGSRLQLARTLEARGLHREAIPIYRLSLDESPDEISPARGFFSACLKSREYRPALEVIAAYLSGEKKQPAGMTEDFVYRQHAEFLMMAGDIETLTARALGGGGGPANRPAPAGSTVGFGPAEGLDHAVFYQSALVRSQERRGNDEAMLRILTHLREAGRITKEERLMAGRASLRLGDRAGALGWWDGIVLDQQQAIVEVEAIRERAALYATETPPNRAALGELARSSAEYQDLRLVKDLAVQLFAGGSATEGRGYLLLAARNPRTSRADRLSLLTLLARLRLEAGDPVEEVVPDLQVLFENLTTEAESLRGWFELAESEAPAGDPARAAAWAAWLEPYLAQPRTRLAAGAALWKVTGGPIDPDWKKSLSPREIDLGIEWMPLLGEAGAAVSRDWLARRPGPLQTLCDGSEVRQIRLFGRLGDRVRAAEVQTRLRREAETDGFQQFTVRRRTSTAFGERWPLPEVLAEAGFPDLAGGLYQAYHASIRRLTWEHNQFLESYVRFLIGRKEFSRAESLLTPAFQKSIGTDPQLVVDLYRSWGKLAEWSERTGRLQLTSGLKVHLDELRALAETTGLSKP